MTKKLKMKSGHVAVDVTEGRYAIKKRLKDGEKVELTLRVVLENDDRSQKDDGVSIEFIASDVTIVKAVAYSWSE